jgi:Mor family transcriptional regulator
VLLDPHTCAHDLLQHINALIPKSQPPVDKDIRDAEIYQRRLQGEATAKLAEAYGLTVQRIRAIIRRMAGKV